jgi:3',5'-cyclic AMP phosphodiesterase CpdA
MKDETLLNLLLQGHFLYKRSSIRRGYDYALYTSNMSVVQSITSVQFNKHSAYFKGTLKFTLNLSKVRQLHGKCLAKILYKKHIKNLKNAN